MTTITIDRALLEQALEALEAMQMEARARNCGLKICDDSIEALRAALAAQPEPHPRKGIPRIGCDYLAPCDMPCNKCGEVHRHHQMVARFDAHPGGQLVK